MNLSPIARRVKIRISSGGTSHADLDSLLRRFSVADLAPLVADGRLGRWLVQIDEPAKAAAIESFAGADFSQVETITSFLHAFFDFDSLDSLASKWKELGLETNLKNLLHARLLRENQALALAFAESDFGGEEVKNKELWNQVLPYLNPEDAESALKLAGYLETLSHTGRAKAVMKQFASDDKVKKIVEQTAARNILNELKFWLTNIRLIRPYRPNLKLDDEENTTFLNTALHTISLANRNYYSKRAEESGSRYWPSILVGQSDVLDLMQSRHKARYMKVVRLIAALCKMQFFDKGGSVSVGAIPGLPLLSHQGVVYSSTVKTRKKEIKTLDDFCHATFSAQIIYIVTETLVNNYQTYFDNEA